MSVNFTEYGPDIPEHVPASLVSDFDYFAVARVNGDLHLGWHVLHHGPDIFFTPRNGGHCLITRAEDIKEAYGNLDPFISAGQNAIPRQVRDVRFSPAEFDPAELDDVRLLLLPRFNPAAINALETTARALCVSLTEGAEPDGGCEFVSAFAKHMPIQIFLTMMDLPLGDASRLAPIIERQIHDPSMEAMNQSFAAMLSYLDEKVTARKRSPGDVIISSLLARKMNNAPVPHADILSICMTLMFAGLDTVVSAQSFFMRCLATHPAHRRQLVENPALIGNAVEELCRHHGVTNLARSAAKEIVYKGVTMKAGEQILLPTVVFGLDEGRLTDPVTIDFTRRDVTHFIFGGGVHRCQGLHLARMELRVMLEERLPRIPDFSVDEDIGSEAKSGKVNAMDRRPLRVN